MLMFNWNPAEYQPNQFYYHSANIFHYLASPHPFLRIFVSLPSHICTYIHMCTTPSNDFSVGFTADCNIVAIDRVFVIE